MTASPRPDLDPDVSADVVTVLPAPRREPQFDDELPTRHLRLIASREPQLPFVLPPRRSPIGPNHAVDAAFAVQLTARHALRDPESFTRRLLVAAFEALAGRRPLTQLSRFLTPGVYADLATEFERARRDKRQDREWTAPSVMRSIRICEPADGVAELAAVVQTGPRYRAVALRLEGLDGRWRCVSLELG